MGIILHKLRDIQSMEPVVRRETPRDYSVVETMIRIAFYNIYVPGCTERYLVHILRTHEDFIPELDFVLELDRQVIGNIMYTRAVLKIDEVAAQQYDETLEAKAKRYQPSQEAFYILSQSFLPED